MGTHLVQEFCRFCRESKRLRQLLRDTRRCFRDINSVRGADGKRPCTAQVSEQENGDIDSNINKVPCIFVFGQTCAAKVHIINQVFQQVVLPQPKGEPQWRTVCFRYGSAPSLSLSLPGNFELVNDLMIKDDAWKIISAQNLELRESESDTPDLADGIATLEVKMRHTLLRDGGMVAMAPSSVDGRCAWEDFGRISKNRVPVIIYAIAKNKLSEQDLSFLRELLEFYPDISVFFVKVPSTVSPCLPNNCCHDNRHSRVRQSKNDDDAHTDALPVTNQNNFHIIIDTKARKLDSDDEVDTSSSPEPTSATLDVFQQLLQLGFLSPLPPSQLSSSKLTQTFTESGGSSRANDSELVEDFDRFPDAIAAFTHQVLERHLLHVTNLLHFVHTRTLEMFILVAFDMSRDMLLTPRKLEFAREREGELYNSLMQMALLKQNEIQNLIATTISSMREELLSKATEYEFIGVNIPESGYPQSSSDLKVCSAEIQNLMLGSLNRAIAGKLLSSVDVLRDSYTGVLTRCLCSLEETDNDTTEATRTTEALKEILNSAYQVEITVRAGASLACVLLEKMKQLMHSMPWRTSPLINNEWKRKVAADMLDSLRETRLAKSICSQIKNHLRRSHDTFTAALKQLETRHSGRLERTEEQRLRLRKCHAPRVARLVLESTSIRDSILFGMPVLGREIGRGQYGVVYSCDSWAGVTPCAIKTVVPPDDRHWNDLALEFYYTKNVPEHDRIVALRGAIIDTTFSLASPAVLLVMDRLQRDLYVAIKTGLDWLSRLQVAIDVVEGIRYLHSLGLVHRDIKLKNVLLDKQNRGKITDLGFCKPEAMMSGSIVGTPIHMAPELFTKRYDNSVDVYAFGILFWYVCAGHTQLPYAFEQCQDKEMLWTSVKRGIRPERLPQFRSNCWELMNESWDGNPSKRPLLGDVEVRLRAIYRQNHDVQENKRRHLSHRLSPGPLPSETGLSSIDMDSI